MKILIVTKHYVPHGDATGAVVRNLTEALIARGHSVHVAALTAFREDEQVKCGAAGEEITNCYVPEAAVRAQLMRTLRENPAGTGWTILRRAAAEAERSLRPGYRGLSVYPPYARAFRKLFRTLLRREEGFDLCLITLMPQDAVWAFQREQGKAFGKDIPWAVYQLDTYWNRATDTEEYQEERKAFERRMASECAFVLTTPLIVRANEAVWPDLKGKWISSEFPMVKLPREGKAREAGATLFEANDGKLHCVFAGALYPGLRPPEGVVRVIAAWKKQEPEARICFDFYGGHQELVTASPDYPDAKEWIALHGAVSSREAAEAREAADFLLNIDNTNPLQVPSKIFEYISTGKPILNIVFDDRSPILSYLRDYPLCLTLNLGGTENSDAEKERQAHGAAQCLAAFVRENRGKRMNREEILSRYERCTPDYVAGQLEQACLNHCGKYGKIK